MNREILFKAKRTDNGEWVEGYYVKYQPCASRPEYVHGIVPTYASALYMIKIDPDTLCQYTGLTDKNDKRIWENDIIRTFENDSKDTLINIVKFIDGCFKVFKKHYLPMTLDCYEKSDLESIGNIFDNLDLLDEG